MLPLPKKSADKSGATVSPPWRPNFRNFAQLPDTKVVRTSFFINVGAVVILTGLLLLVSYQEYRLADLHRSIRTVEEQIARDQPLSKEAVSAYAKFKAEEAKAKELSSFYSQERVKVSAFLIHLGKGLPRDVALRSVECSPTQVSMTAHVKGITEQAGKVAEAYQQQLKADPYLQSLFEITVPYVTRDKENQRWVLSIVMKYKTPPSAQ